MSSLGEITAVFDTIRATISSYRGNRKLDTLRDMRAALHALHFSDQTIDMLMQLLASRNGPNSEYLIGRLAIVLRDTRHAVTSELITLTRFGENDRLSIGAKKLLGRIETGKLEIRDHMSRALLEGSWKHDVEALPGLIAKIKELNREIEALDEQLGGIIL